MNTKDSMSEALGIAIGGVNVLALHSQRAMKIESKTLRHERGPALIDSGGGSIITELQVKIQVERIFNGCCLSNTGEGLGRETIGSER